jgi:hypothetical protein
MGWKVRSDQLKSVKARVKDRGGREEVRWKVAQYKIKEALVVRGQKLEDGLDITDFQYLTNQGILIGDAANLLSDAMPELKSQRYQLEAIKDYFIPYYSYSRENFLNDYLKIKHNIHGTWTRFLNGETAIEYEAFQTICSVLDLDCHKIGTDTREMPDWKKLETLLWQLNHTDQIRNFQNLAQTSHNLVCLKFLQVPERNIPLFWLLKTLVQPVDNGIQKAGIDFNSLIYSDSNDRLDSIIAQLGLPDRLKAKKKPDAIAKEISKKIVKTNQTIALFFLTHDRQKLTELDELVSLLYQPLQQEFSQRQPQQKLLMVWIDSQPSSQGESDDLNWEGDNYPAYSKISFCSRFDRDDIASWTKLKEVNLLFDRTRNDSSDCPFMQNNLADVIWQESQEGKPEFLLNSVYKLCNLNWETYRNSWQKI